MAMSPRHFEYFYDAVRAVLTIDEQCLLYDADYILTDDQVIGLYLIQKEGTKIEIIGADKTRLELSVKIHGYMIGGMLADGTVHT